MIAQTCTRCGRRWWTWHDLRRPSETQWPPALATVRDRDGQWVAVCAYTCGGPEAAREVRVTTTPGVPRAPPTRPTTGL